tara:strand:+ start:78291 stop:78806 length:516 start_codon:yes stop_codon:yes gene_type:complete
MAQDATTPQTAPLEGKLHFNALVMPHRSLSRKGFIIVMSILVVMNFGAGLLFLLKGAWPVMGFCGLDVALVWWAFRANYRAARAHETVQVSDDELLIRRIDQHGRVRATSLQPYWARLDMVEEPDGATHLFVRSHGRSHELAAFLSPDERAGFARALQNALDTSKARPQTV